MLLLCSPVTLISTLLLYHMWGDMAKGGKSCRLAVGGLPVRSHPGCLEVSLSKTPPIAPDELVGTLHDSQSALVCE